MSREASVEEIDLFLESTEFSGYQSVPLPRGRRIPGRDRTTAIVSLLREVGVEGKTVLDVGTYYGALPAAASGLGAISIGLEPERCRYDIAAKAATLAGGRWEVRYGSVEELDSNEKFECVFLLNVIHHIDTPVAFLRKLALHCTDRLVVEFPLAHDLAATRYLFDRSGSGHPTPIAASLALGGSALMWLASLFLPVVLLGNRPYHRRWHFSARAFRTLSEQMIDGVESVTVKRSSWSRRRAVAVLKMSRP